MTAGPPELTAEDRAAIDAILARGVTLPCGGRTWAGPFNGDQPIYHLLDKSGPRSARKIVHALNRERETGVFEWPEGQLYSLDWACIDHLTTNRAERAKPPPPTPDYVRVSMSQHPLATRAGRVLEHRAALHRKLGDGPQPCHYCGLQLRWGARPGDADELTVEHLNGQRDDNRAENLVPSCRPHNSARLHLRDVHAHSYDSFRTTVATGTLTPPDQARTSQTGQTRHSYDVGQKPTRTRRTTCFETMDRALSHIRDDRRLRVALVLAGLAVAGWVGPVWALTSLLPGTGRGDPRPTATTDGTVTTTAPLVAIDETPVPTSAPPRGPSTTTWWTMPPPCTPSSCPSLDD